MCRTLHDACHPQRRAHRCHCCKVQVKRRWDDDVVFRNQERGEPKVQKRFVNDTIRNDFHRRFLNRYIK